MMNSIGGTPAQKRALTLVKLTSIFLVLCPATITLADTQTPVGLWESVSDVTGEVTSTVRIKTEGRVLVGTIEKLFRKPGEDPKPRCTECRDEKKDRPIEGLRILWGLQRDGSEWNGGYILDPENGQTYRSRLKLIADGQKLEVRGFIGISLFGRTQIWNRR